MRFARDAAGSVGHGADVIGEGIDVAFRGGELHDSSLVARKLAGLPIVLVVSPH